MFLCIDIGTVFTQRNFGDEAEVLHSIKADVAWRLIRRYFISEKKIPIEIYEKN